VMYANGQGVTASAEQASKWFQQAASQGVADAATSLANIYREEGQFKNYSEAEKWYRKAAEQGIASAAFDLGVMYDVGQGVQKNYDEALKWYRQAADAGYASALTNLGILYYNAQGVKRDLVQSYAWFARAEKAGDPRAPQMLKIAASKMKPGDVKKAQSIVAQWQPSKKSTEADRLADARLFKQPPAVALREPEPASTPAPKQAPAGEASAQTAEAAHAPAAPAPQAVWPEVDRVVAVGDVHGDYEQFVLALESAGLVDGNTNWTGGNTHLVQTGDIVDRGPDSRKIMDLLIRLEPQAAKAGGGVHALIGNHEAMDLYGDLRFVSPSEYASYRIGASDADRQISYEEAHRILTASATPDGPHASSFVNPPGFAEHRAAFAPGGVYGKWLRSHNAVIKIGRTLFVHAGLGPKYADWPIDRINDQIRAELADLTRLHGGIVTDEQGPFWFNGLAKGNDAQLVDRLLRNFDVDRIVIGHTYANAAITPRFNGKVVMIDVGLSRIYDNVGKLGCLLIEKGKPYALHRGQKLELPKDEGPDMLRYLKQAAILDPQPSPLAARIRALE
jgi:hypothetical protein